MDFNLIVTICIDYKRSVTVELSTDFTLYNRYVSHHSL